MFLVIELTHVLEKLDFSSIMDRSSVLRCGLFGTIDFNILAATFVKIRITLWHCNFPNSVMLIAVIRLFFLYM